MGPQAVLVTERLVTRATLLSLICLALLLHVVLAAREALSSSIIVFVGLILLLLRVVIFVLALVIFVLSLREAERTSCLNFGWLVPQEAGQGKAAEETLFLIDA